MKRFLILSLISFGVNAQDLTSAQKAYIPDVNFVTNGGVEKTAQGWSFSAGSGGQTTDADSVRTGQAAFEWSPEASGRNISFPLFTIPAGGLGTCEASVWYKFTGNGEQTGTFHVRTSGGTQVSDSVEIDDRTSGELSPWRKLEFTFPCMEETATSYRIYGESTSAAGIYIFDDYYGGVARGIGTVAQSYHFGSLTYADTSGCDWGTSTTSATPPAFSAASACPTPSVTGKVKAPATKIPAFIIPAGSAPGTYNITVTGRFECSRSATAANCMFYFFDGTNYFSGQRPGILTGGANSNTIRVGSLVGRVIYSGSSTDTLIEIRATNTTTGNSPEAIVLASSNNLEFNVYYFPTSEQIVHRGDEVRDTVGDVFYTSKSQCPVGSLLADGSAISRSKYAALFSAIGTTYGVGDGSTTFNLPNVEGLFIRATGSQSVNGRTKGGSTLGQVQEDQMQRITGSGGNFASATTVSAGALSSVNDGANIGTGGSHYGRRRIDLDTANSPDARTSSTTDGETFPTNIAFNACISYVAESRPIIPGSVYSGRSSVVKVGIARILCQASTAIDSNLDGMVASAGNLSSGTCAVTLTTGYFSSAPLCTASLSGNDDGFTRALVNSSTSVTIGSLNTGAASGSRYVTLFCVGN